MAGFFSLGRDGTALLFTTLLASSLFVRGQMTNMAPAAPMASAPANGVAPKPGAPPIPEDDFQRYGKIISPGSEPSHPLKLSLPILDVGQVKIPTQDELVMRDKLEHLATMSDDDIRKDLAQWPAYNKMSLADEGAMLMRIQLFKDHRAKEAQERAHALGLLTLKPDQLEKFETEYWDKRLEMDRDLAKQFEPIYKARENKLEEDLFREFSTPAVPVPPPAPPKPPTPPPAPTTPPAAQAQPMQQK